MQCIQMQLDIPKQITQLPTTAGVYMFYDKNNTIVYIGKSINIKKRVQQHFSSSDRKSKKIQLATHRISFETTGSELIALLHETELIKEKKPLYNRQGRRIIFTYGLYSTMEDEYLCLKIAKVNTSNDTPIMGFINLKRAKDKLFEITDSYQLCQKLNGLYPSPNACFGYQIKTCYGACIKEELPEEYNLRVQKFLDRNSLKQVSKIIQVPGRNPKEKGIVHIENGVYKGFGFSPKNLQQSEQLEYIQKKSDNKDARRILMRYILNDAS